MLNVTFYNEFLINHMIATGATMLQGNLKTKRQVENV